MIELRPKTLSFVWLAIAGCLFAAAATVHAPIDKLSRQYELVPAGNASMAKHPELALLKVTPGGLRSIMVNYLWIRSQNLHREGRHFDAMQLAELICSLQPRFPGVWQFQSWQLAWNISATAHTPQERWHWVTQGVELLRDRGIPANPDSLLLYKQLGWTFTSKMGDNTDDMHWYYKQKLAQDMQHLLGAQTLGSTEETLAAFKLIAEASIDKSDYKPRHASEPIQTDMRRKLLEGDPELTALNNDLDAIGLEIGPGLLTVYNYCTLDDAVDVTRVESLEDRDMRLRVTADKVKDPAERTRRLDELDRRAQWAKVINNPGRKKALDKALAFIRAQILWNVYKMDPAYMYKLMEKAGPIDWRLVWSHGLYWAKYGADNCKDLPPETVDNINTDRTFLTCLKTLTWRGKMEYLTPPSRMEGESPMPFIRFRSDWRFIEAVHREYEELGKEHAKIRNKEFKDNPLKDGHINFLGNAIEALFIQGRLKEAQKHFDWVRNNYDKKDDKIWGAETLEKFVIASLSEQENLIPRITTAQLTASLQMALVWLASGDVEGYEKNMNYARRLFNKYRQYETMRTRRTIDLEITAADILSELMVRPKMMNFDLSLEKRSTLYRSLMLRWPRLAARVYDRIGRPLLRKCQNEKLDFFKLFPRPELLNTIRRERAAEAKRRQ